MTRRFLVALLLLAIFGAAAACQGRSVARSNRGPARRIVSLVPAATEALFAMGAGPSVIAVSSFDRYPPEVTRLPKVGALLDPDLERIIALTPDLVVVFEGQQELRDKISAAGIGVFAYPRPSLAGIKSAIRSLGELTGKRAGAAQEVARIERGLDEVRKRAANEPSVRTMLVIGREPGTLRNVYVSGGIGFLAELLDIAGAANVFGSVKRENLQATTETILASQPDAIVEVVASQPWTAADIEREEHVWDSLSSLPAVRNHRVYLLVGDEFVIPGPRVVDAAQKIAAALH